MLYNFVRNLAGNSLRLRCRLFSVIVINLALMVITA